MRTVHILEGDDLDRVEFKCRFVCDRQYPDVSIEDLMKSEILHRFSRFDMFWIECSISGIDLGPLVVEPDREDPRRLTIGRNHCRVDDIEPLFTRARKWFVEQPEFKKQQEWVQAIIDKFYTPYGGRSGFEAESKRIYDQWQNKKIECAKKYATEIAEYLRTKIGKNALDVAFNEAGVYLDVKTLIYSGFDHLIWIYKTYVESK